MSDTLTKEYTEVEAAAILLAFWMARMNLKITFPDIRTVRTPADKEESA